MLKTEMLKLLQVFVMIRTMVCPWSKRLKEHKRTRLLEERTLNSQKVSILEGSPCCYLNHQKS